MNSDGEVINDSMNVPNYSVCGVINEIRREFGLIFLLIKVLALNDFQSFKYSIC